MKLNENIMIFGDKTVLVPYCKHHVLRYHEWMKNEELQKLTASEPLTLKEEFEMQKIWHQDEFKCTFIVLDKEIYKRTGNDPEAMIGDTNIFISMEDSIMMGEIEIMIAEENFRGKKYGLEAVIIMLLYGIKQIKIDSYQAKISIENVPSINMFQKLGFEKKSQSDVFKEITLEKKVDKSWISYLENKVKYDLIEKPKDKNS